MSQLADVRYALKQGKTQEAGQILKQVLKESPSADAWYLAARMVQDRDKKVYYLRQALRFDSRHYESREMLQSLTGKRDFTAREQVVSEVKSIVEESTLLQRLAPWMRVPIFLLVVILAFTATQWALKLLISSPAPQFKPAPTLLIAPEAFLGTFEDSGLVLAAEQVPSEGVAALQWQLAIRPDEMQMVNANGEVVQPDLEDAALVDVFFYNSAAEMATDQTVLNERLSEGYTLLSYHTVAMTYPSSLPPGTAYRLEQLFNSVPAFRDLLEATETAIMQATADMNATETAVMQATADMNATEAAIMQATANTNATEAATAESITATANVLVTLTPQ